MIIPNFTGRQITAQIEEVKKKMSSGACLCVDLSGWWVLFGGGQNTTPCASAHTCNDSWFPNHILLRWLMVNKTLNPKLSPQQPLVTCPGIHAAAQKKFDAAVAELRQLKRGNGLASFSSVSLRAQSSFCARVQVHKVSCCALSNSTVLSPVVSHSTVLSLGCTNCAATTEGRRRTTSAFRFPSQPPEGRRVIPASEITVLSHAKVITGKQFCFCCIWGRHADGHHPSQRFNFKDRGVLNAAFATSCKASVFIRKDALLQQLTYLITKRLSVCSR
jgi:hypothetical protein